MASTQEKSESNEEYKKKKSASHKEVKNDSKSDSENDNNRRSSKKKKKEKKKKDKKEDRKHKHSSRSSSLKRHPENDKIKEKHSKEEEQNKKRVKHKDDRSRTHEKENIQTREPSRHHRSHSRSISRRKRSRSNRRSYHRRSSRLRSRQRSRSRTYDHAPRRQSRSRSRSKTRSRTRSKSKRSPSTTDSSKPQELTLGQIIMENPGISVHEAIAKLNMIKMNKQFVAAGQLIQQQQQQQQQPISTVQQMSLLNQQQNQKVIAQPYQQLQQPQTAQQIQLQALSQSIPTLPSSMPSTPMGNMAFSQNFIPFAAQTKPLRELYVGNLPASVNPQHLVEFLNTVILQLGLNTQPGGPALTSWLSPDGHYGFVELRSIEETNNAMSLNGVQFNLNSLRVGRPKTYPGDAVAQQICAALHASGISTSASVTTPASLPGTIPNQLFSTTNSGIGLGTLAVPVPNMPLTSVGIPPAISQFNISNEESNVLMLSNLPVTVEEKDIEDLLKTFGELEKFNLLKDSEGKSKGVVVFEYQERPVTENTLKTLQNHEIGGSKVSIQRVPAHMVPTLLNPIAVSGPKSKSEKIDKQKETKEEEENEEDEFANQPSKVIRLVNMVSIHELEDDEEFNDILEDVKDECSKYGKVLNVEIPRPFKGENDQKGVDTHIPGLGSIFVEFEDFESALKAKNILSSRTFEGKQVKGTFYPHHLFLIGKYEIPKQHNEYSERNTSDVDDAELD